MRAVYESRHVVAAPWWRYLLLWIGFTGSLALIPATSQLFNYWGGNGSGSLPWVWLVPAAGFLITLLVTVANRNQRKLTAEYQE